MLYGIFLVTMAALMLLTMYIGFVRNTQVYRFRKDILDGTMIEASRGDWRLAGDQLDAYDTVSYDQMLLKFWKPLDVKTWYAGTVLDR